MQPSDKCKPSRPDKSSDGSGLELWVRHTENKVCYADTHQGKLKNLAPGKHPTLTLSQASKAAASDNCFDVFAQKWLSHQETRTEQTTIQNGS